MTQAEYFSFRRITSMNGIVVHVDDGDTAVVVDENGERLDIRFYGIDTPETRNIDLGWDAQPYSSEAKEFTKRMIEDKTVFVRLKGEQTYGRSVGEIFINGQSVSRELARAGLAWWNKKYQGDDLDIAQLVSDAREAQKGLWADKSPIAPWKWRSTKGGTVEADEDSSTLIARLKQLFNRSFQPDE
ncbi:thermonuclease family protein [uncultured Roseobacter sp.]|uniref:thermonuclease family protein n=1 Tax=uncultured Roseobacter sp. TaxID=114847 RepID=UPI002630F6E0|nr:thermonuclease family protein [uncultured Roseobacter sp.]